MNKYRAFSFSGLLLLAAWLVSQSALAENRPTLQVALADGKAILTWAAGTPDWHLFASTSLSPADSQIVPNAPEVVGNQNVVTVPINSSQQFYHLQKRGAILPFITIEAEAVTNTTTGTSVKMTLPPLNNVTTPELEASNRGYVELNQTGQYLDIPVPSACNTIVLRHCIPDAPTGGGITGTLSLYVNGVFRQKLSLTSRYNWLYGTAGKNGQSNDPSLGNPHVFWDETRAFITGGIAEGDTLRLQKDADDVASFYRIDLADLENVGAPLNPPVAGTYLSVADYGADGSGLLDDTAAIASCITDAKATGKSVWIPPGTYYQSASFSLNGVTVQGAGMWYTNLVGTTISKRSSNLGFVVKGDGACVSDLSIDSIVNTNRSEGSGAAINGNYNFSDNWKVTNVWITHTVAGMWISGSKHGLVRGCRVRLTYADAINLNRGTSDSIVEMNHVRGCGDDGLAISSETTNTPATSMRDTLRSNTVVANWWGHNCDLAGGGGHLVEDNYFADNAVVGCLTINLPSAYPMYALADSTIRRNRIARGGGYTGGQKRGAVWIYPGNQTISNTTISDNEITDAIFYGIHLVGTKNQQITFERNIMANPGVIGCLIESQVVGSGVWNSNLVRSASLNSLIPYTNKSINYTDTLNGNSWQ